jgi:hypothetical protein
MQVKIFQSSYTNSLETEVGDWLHKNSNIKIKKIKQSSAQYSNTIIQTTISIFYNIKSKPQDFGPG